MRITNAGLQTQSVAQRAVAGKHTLSIPIHNSSLADVRRLIRQVCADTLGPCDDTVKARIGKMELAATELLSNVIRHGFPGTGDAVLPESGRLQVEVMINNLTQLVFRLEHHGEPFEGYKSEIQEVTEPQEGGMGLFLISQCVDHVAYSCPMPGQNLVWLTTNLNDNS